MAGGNTSRWRDRPTSLTEVRICYFFLIWFLLGNIAGCHA